MIAEAEELQQRAERKRRATPEAVNAFLLAVVSSKCQLLTS